MEKRQVIKKPHQGGLAARSLKGGPIGQKSEKLYSPKKTAAYRKNPNNGDRKGQEDFPLLIRIRPTFWVRWILILETFMFSIFRELGPRFLWHNHFFQRCRRRCCCATYKYGTKSPCRDPR